MVTLTTKRATLIDTLNSSLTTDNHKRIDRISKMVGYMSFSDSGLMGSGPRYTKYRKDMRKSLSDLESIVSNLESSVPKALKGFI